MAAVRLHQIAFDTIFAIIPGFRFPARVTSSFAEHRRSNSIMQGSTLRGWSHLRLLNGPASMAGLGAGLVHQCPGLRAGHLLISCWSVHTRFRAETGPTLALENLAHKPEARLTNPQFSKKNALNWFCLIGKRTLTDVRKQNVQRDCSSCP